jgi:SAM-dependent methyltransferase
MAQDHIDQMECSVQEWDDFFKNNNVIVPYLDLCVFAVKKLRALPKSSTVYEFGCGMGNNLKFIRGIFENVRLLGSDISIVAINKLQSEKLPNSEFWVNDHELRIVEKNIDLVIERGALQHVPKDRARRYIDEIYRSMKVGGEGFFEIASTSHGLFRKLGESGYDKGYGYRTFYTIDDINILFSQFKIKRIYHLSREVVMDSEGGVGVVQGSFQIEIEKTAAQC